MRNTRKLKMLVLVIGVFLVGVTVAYAALSATLNVTINKITQTGGTWCVKFSNTGNSIAASDSGATSSTGFSCGTATITDTTVTISDTQLSKPDDYCQYTLVVSNCGSVAAKITGITPTNPSGTTCSTSSGAQMVCGATNKTIRYTLTSDTGASTLITTSTSALTNLAGSATYTIYLTAKYNGTQLNSTAVNQTGAAFTLSWSQK